MDPESEALPLLHGPHELAGLQDVRDLADGDAGDQEVHIHGVHEVRLPANPREASKADFSASVVRASL